MGISERSDGTGRRLLFEVSLEADEQDRALGMDTCHLRATGSRTASAPPISG